MDYSVLNYEFFGRRINFSDPDRSLLLLKATMQLSHEGGKRFDVGSAEYAILSNWISAGMPSDSVATPQFVQLEVTPNEVFLTGEIPAASDPQSPVWHQQIAATAKYSDGSSRDVTSLAVFEVAQPIADVSHDGLVVGRVAGETTILVRYLHQQIPVRMAFLTFRPDFVWSAPHATNFIDEQVFAKLQKLRINPAMVSDDATFYRRLSLDLLGVLPSSAEARKFVTDTLPNKRALLIDALLERPEFSEWWAMKWADLLRIEEKTLDRKGVENFHAWLRDAFETHKPLDQMVREIVTGRGSTYEVPPANFYRALRTPFERSETIGQLFLGVRLQCSKCHNHPFDRWTQDDYYSWGSVFARVDYKILENRRRDSNDKHEFDGEQIVYLRDTGEAKDPRTNQGRRPTLLGQASELNPEQDPLAELATWLTNPHHDRFVQMLANRTWQQVMGRGIVDPIDDFRATNPPSNPQLLADLARHLSTPMTSGAQVQAFDVRHLLRVILNSQTYQLSAEANESNRDDEINFSRAIIRRHSAEQLLDATSQVLQTPLDFAGYPKGRRAAQLPGVATRLRDAGPSDADQFLQLFGKPPRLQACDCERSEETTLGQTFQLVSGGLINRLLATQGNRLDTLVQSTSPVAEIVTELYWSALTRPPTVAELATAQAILEKSPNRRASLEDITWAILNSNEFLLRH